MSNLFINNQQKDYNYINHQAVIITVQLINCTFIILCNWQLGKYYNSGQTPLENEKMENLYFTIKYEHQHSYFLCTVFIKVYFYKKNAQWEFRQLTLNPFYLEDKTEVKVD